MRSIIPVLVFPIIGLPSLSAQGLTARQLFYAEEPQAKPPEQKKTVAKKEGGARTGKKQVEVARNDSKTPDSKQSSSTSSSGVTRPPVVDASYKPVAAKPLALRYSLMQIVEDKATEVSADATFRSGDKVQLKVEGNREGYLYVVSRGSSGNWKALFPSPEIAGGDNHIAARRQYQIPSAHAFVFDEQAGQEELFLVYSQDPVEDFGSLMESLGRRKDKPAQTTILAQNLGNINDGVVSRLRTVYSRDLLIQKMESKPAQDDAKGENAVYVANGAGGRVVADIRLVHR